MKSKLIDSFRNYIINTKFAKDIKIGDIINTECNSFFACFDKFSGHTWVTVTNFDTKYFDDILAVDLNFMSEKCSGRLRLNINSLVRVKIYLV